MKGAQPNLAVAAHRDQETSFERRQMFQLFTRYFPSNLGALQEFTLLYLASQEERGKQTSEGSPGAYI